MASYPYRGRLAHPIQDSRLPVQRTPPPPPPPYHPSPPPMFSNSTHFYDYSSPPTPRKCHVRGDSQWAQSHQATAQPTPYFYTPTPGLNNRVHASTASSPTPTAYGLQPSFSSTTSVSELNSRLEAYFCVHEGCDEKTYVSPSTLKKHDWEKHCNRKARCVRCRWEGPRKHRHPPTCNGRLSFSVVEKEDGYPCGWCDKHFAEHGAWFKHIVEHQRQGELKSDYQYEVTTSTEPRDREESPQSQQTFNPALVAGSNQFSPSAAEHVPSPQLSPLSDAPADPELDISMSPGADVNDIATAFSPSSSSEASETPRGGPTAMMLEFDGVFAGDGTLDGTREDVPPSSFNFDNTPLRNPLLGLGVFLQPRYPPQENVYAHALTAPPFTHNNECATPAPPPFEFVNPQYTFSDAGSHPDQGE